jgi:hypothetical protein
MQQDTCGLLIIYRLFQLVYFNIIFQQVIFSNNSLNRGVFHLLINSHRSSPFQCCGQFMFEALLSRTKLPSSRRAFPHLFHKSSMQTFAQTSTNWQIFWLALTLLHCFFPLTNKNFGHVCVPIKVSALFSVYYVAVSTVAYSMYVWSIMYLQFYSHVF